MSQTAGERPWSRLCKNASIPPAASARLRARFPRCVNSMHPANLWTAYMRAVLTGRRDGYPFLPLPPLPLSFPPFPLLLVQGADELHAHIESMEAILRGFDEAFRAPSAAELSEQVRCVIKSPEPAAAVEGLTFQRRSSSAGRKPATTSQKSLCIYIYSASRQLLLKSLSILVAFYSKYTRALINSLFRAAKFCAGL